MKEVSSNVWYVVWVVGVFLSFKLVLKTQHFSPHFEVVNFNSNATYSSYHSLQKGELELADAEKGSEEDQQNRNHALQ